MNLQEELQACGIRETRLLIDWISTTAPYVKHEARMIAHPSLGTFEGWEDSNGKMGYTIGAKHVTGTSILKNDSREDMGVHIIYSGKSLSNIEREFKVKPIDVLRHHIFRRDKIARLDIAIDFINWELNVIDFENAFMNKDCQTRLRSATKVASLTGKGETLYIGSRTKRKKLVRVYDKAAELGLQGDWIRLEYQIMGKPATNAGKLMASEKSLVDAIIKIAVGICTFPTITAFNQATEGIAGVKIGTISGEKGNTREWISKQCVPAIAKLIILDADYWIQLTDEIFNVVQDIDEEVVKNERNSSFKRNSI